MKGRLANLALAVGSLVVFLGGAELLARTVDLRSRALANPPWLGERWLLRRDYREQMAAEGLLSRYYDLYEWDRYLFFRLRPNVDLELLDVMAPPALRERTRWSVHTNERGFRTAPFADRPAPGVTRVAVLGDSSTFGWGVEAFEAYPARLQGELASRWGVPPERIEVLNLGVPGYSSFQGKVLLERVALPLAPHVVVWSFLSNDGAVTGQADAAAYARRLGPTGALLAALHASHAFEAFESWIAAARARLAPPAPPDPHDPTHRNVGSYEAARGHVEAAVTAARRAGVPIALVAQCIRAAPAAVMADVARETGAPHVDATALLDASIAAIAADPAHARDRQRLAKHWGAEELAEHPYWLAFLPDGCHPNAVGHRLAAAALADALVAALPAPGAPAGR